LNLEQKVVNVLSSIISSQINSCKSLLNNLSSVRKRHFLQIRQKALLKYKLQVKNIISSENINKSIMNYNKEHTMKNSLQEELLRICEEKKKLQLQLEDAHRTISKKEIEIVTLDKACKFSMNQNTTNNKFLGMAIIMKSLNSARVNQTQIRKAIKVWRNC